MTPAIKARRAVGRGCCRRQSSPVESSRAQPSRLFTYTHRLVVPLPCRTNSIASHPNTTQAHPMLNPTSDINPRILPISPTLPCPYAPPTQAHAMHMHMHMHMHTPRATHPARRKPAASPSGQSLGSDCCTNSTVPPCCHVVCSALLYQPFDAFGL